MNKRDEAVVARLFLTAALAAVAFYALVLGGAYIHLALPDGTLRALGPTGYFLLASLLSGGLVGAGLGTVHRRALRASSFVWIAACLALVVAPYIWLQLAPVSDWAAPGWWIPLVEGGAFAVMFIVALRLGVRKAVRPSARPHS